MIGGWHRREQRGRASDLPPAGPDLSDGELLAALSRNDRAALSCLYDRYSTFVFTLSRACCPNRAEETTELAFLDLWRHRRELQEQASVVEALVQAVFGQIAHTGSNKFEQPSSGGNDRTAVLAPFAGLPSRTRHILLAACLGALGPRQIATALAISEITVLQVLATGLAHVGATVSRPHFAASSETTPDL